MYEMSYGMLKCTSYLQSWFEFMPEGCTSTSNQFKQIIFLNTFFSS